MKNQFDEKSYLLEIPDDYKVRNELLGKRVKSRFSNTISISDEVKRDMFDDSEDDELFKNAIESKIPSKSGLAIAKHAEVMQNLEFARDMQNQFHFRVCNLSTSSNLKRSLSISVSFS